MLIHSWNILIRFSPMIHSVNFIYCWIWRFIPKKLYIYSFLIHSPNFILGSGSVDSFNTVWVCYPLLIHFATIMYFLLGFDSLRRFRFYALYWFIANDLCRSLVSIHLSLYIVISKTCFTILYLSYFLFCNSLNHEYLNIPFQFIALHRFNIKVLDPFWQSYLTFYFLIHFTTIN